MLGRACTFNATVLHTGLQLPNDALASAGDMELLYMGRTNNPLLGK